MNLNRKTVIWILVGLTAGYFLKKHFEKKAVEKYRASAQPASQKVNTDKIERIKIKVFDLIESVHYRYKSDEMTADDLTNYEQIVNHIVS